VSTDLEEMQCELLPSLTAESGYAFGIGLDVSIDDEGFIPGEDEWIDEDESNPRRGGTSHGRDTLQGPLWAFNLHVDRDDRYEALETLGEFKTAWRAMHIRQTPGAVLPLRYQIGQRTRRIYGRPRRLAAPPSNRILGGFVPITVDFSAVDGYTYDDVEQLVTLSLQSGSEGGFVFPLEFPFTTLPVGLSQQQAINGGDADTYPVVRFNGPVDNPSLETDDWVLALDLGIAAGNYVEVDLRPWALTVLLNGESSVSGALGRRTYMSAMKFEPGIHDMVFRGSSVSSSATCEVRWSNAWNSI
jgi:hypothetical protein